MVFKRSRRGRVRRRTGLKRRRGRRLTTSVGSAYTGFPRMPLPPGIAGRRPRRRYRVRGGVRRRGVNNVTRTQTTFENHKFSKKTVGRSKRKSVIIGRFIKSMMDRNIQYNRALDTSFGSPYAPLATSNGDTVNTTKFYFPAGVNYFDPLDKFLPIYCLSLNSANQGSGYLPWAARRMVMSGTATSPATAGSIAWATVRTINSGGGFTSVPWVNELVNNVTGPTFIAGQKVLHKWSELKMNLYGSRTRPVQFSVIIGYFKNPYVYDPFQYKLDTGSIAGQMSREGSQYYQEWIRQLTFNPIDKANVDTGKQFTVVQRLTYKVDPPTSIDADTLPNIQTVKVFIKRDEMLNFNKDLLTEPALGAGQYLPMDATSELTSVVRDDISTVVDTYPSRHLVAFVTSTDYGAANVPTVTGFDWYVRTCFLGASN